MERWTGRVALVTGASSGIGADVAKDLVKHGMKVVGCARRVERIETLAATLKGEKGQLFPWKCDLENEKEILAMFEWIKKELGGVDVCVNNAAYLELDESLLDGTVEKWRRSLNINIIALCLCTKEAVKSMRERGVDDGQIIHISSIAGHYVHPINVSHFYTSTKHAVQALTEAHRQELKQLNTRIRVVSVCPAFVATEGVEEFGKILMQIKGFNIKQPLQAQDISNSVLYILSAQPHVEIRDIVIGNIDVA